jgi:hypothetical protein
MRSFRSLVCLAWLALCGMGWAEPLSLPLDKRPEWLARDGIVMAGSWEPLVFRVRRDGKSYQPTPEQLAGYQQEHAPEMVERLKRMGVNFAMIHCYKGAGLEAERQSMADAVRFSRLCHEAGLRVGVYNFSGAFLWELFFKEIPQAKDWVVRDARGNPLTYGSAGYRYYWNRNHPDAQAFYRKLVRFAVEEIRTDLVHFDNYVVGPGHDACSVKRFRAYLGETFTPAELTGMGIAELRAARPPGPGSPEMLQRAWLDFSCRSLAESYHAMGRYARSLRPDVLVECNPGGVGTAIHAPVDHGRLLQGGEAYWVESGRIGYRDGRLISRIRNYKAGRAMNNVTFDYTLTPLEMAESMAFNLDCLGCLCWFEYGKVVAMPGSDKPVSPQLDPFVRFFHRRRDLLGRARVVADVAVLRSFPSQVFGGPKYSALTARVEDLLIDNRVCFQILYDHQLDGLRRSGALVLAGCVAMGDGEVEAVRRFVASGGRVCAIGPVATHDRWMRPRPRPALDDLPDAAVVRVKESGDWLAAIRTACGGTPSLSIACREGAAPAGLCAELTEQPGRRLVHLVNYRGNGPVRDLDVTLQLPRGTSAKTVRLASPDRPADLPVPFEPSPAAIRFTVPEVKVYEIAVVEFSGP